jgi:hypothetical protein
LTSLNNGWHKGWFYLRNDPEFALPAFTGNSIALERKNGPMAHEGRAGEAAQRSLGGADPPPSGWGHPDDRHSSVPRSRRRTASEASVAPLRDDGRQSPLNGDHDHACIPAAE